MVGRVQGTGACGRFLRPRKKVAVRASDKIQAPKSKDQGRIKFQIPRRRKTSFRALLNKFVAAQDISHSRKFAGIRAYSRWNGFRRE
jgi:hypothetical protein